MAFGQSLCKAKCRWVFTPGYIWYPNIDTHNIIIQLFFWWMQVCVQRTVCAPVLWVLQHIHYKLSKLASRYFILNWWPRKFIMVFGKKTLIFISTKIYALLPPLKQMVKNQRSVLWNKSVFFKVFFSPVNHGRLFIKVILDILIMKKGQNGYGKQTYCIINCTATLP